MIGGFPNPLFRIPKSEIRIFCYAIQLPPSTP